MICFALTCLSSTKHQVLSEGLQRWLCTLTQRLPLQVCRVICSGIANFQQHCSSKRHLRKAAMVAASGRAAAAAAARQAEGLTALGSHASSSSLSSITDPSGQVILNPPDYCQQVRLPGTYVRVGPSGTNATHLPFV